MRRKWLPSLAAVVLMTSTVLLAAPIPASATTSEKQFLSQWTLQVSVKNDFNTTEPYTYKQVQTADYTSVPGGSMSWDATFEERTEHEGSCGKSTSVGTGSGSGTGAMQLTTMGFSPAAFGLAEDQDWTSVFPSTDDRFPVEFSVSYESPHCSGHSSSDTRLPAWGPVFLPGTLEDLAALPAGTVLQDEYVEQGNVYTGGGIEVSYKATKIDTDLETDSDGDGVPNRIDQCAGTPAGATVDGAGCSTDSDDDGVPDGIDQCAGTPAGATVDAAGCVNRPPDAVDDVVHTAARTEVGLYPLANDSDPDGDPISLLSCTSPASGRVEQAGNYVVFTPERGTKGLTTFYCTVTDAEGATAVGTVRVWVGPAYLDLDVAIDYQAYWVDSSPNIGLPGRGGRGKPGSDRVTLRGASTASLSGDPGSLALVDRVCIRPSWAATVTRVTTTFPVDWSDGSVDLSGTPHPFWEMPEKSAAGYVSTLASKAPLCGAAGATSVTHGPDTALIAATNQFGQNANLRDIAHTLQVTVHLRDGQSYSRTFTESESAAKRPPTYDDLDLFPRAISLLR